MAILDQANLTIESDLTYVTNTNNEISAADVRSLNQNWISSSVLIPMTSSMTVLSSSYAVTASYALNAGSASYAATASYAQNANAFPYSGSAVISGSLEIKKIDSRIDNLILSSGSNIFGYRLSNNPTNIENPLLYVSESYDSRGFKGNNIYSIFGTSTASGSIEISGSGNIIYSSLWSNSLTTNNISTINGSNNIVYSLPIVQKTVNNVTKQSPYIVNSLLGGTGFTINDRAGFTPGPNGTRVVNSNLKGAITWNNFSGSGLLINGSENIAPISINQAWSGSTVLINQSHLIGSLTAGNITTQTLSTSAPNVSLRIQGGLINVSNGTFFFPSSSSTIIGVSDSIVFGSGLIVSASTTINTAGTFGSTIVGRNNASDGRIDSLDHIVFAVGSGTNTTTGRRTSLFVSSSGLTQVNAGLLVSGSFIVTGSANFSSGITGSLLGTASYSNQALSSSYAVSSSYALTASYAQNAVIFPYTGSARFSGSIVLTGSFSNAVSPVSIASNTASVDLSTSNFFTVTLPDAVNTFINVVNPKPGQTANIVVTTGINCSASFSSNVKQPSGSFYTPTPDPATDVLSLICVNTSNVLLVKSKMFI